MEAQALQTAVSQFFVPAEPIPRFMPFYLSEDFVKSYARRKVPWGALGEFVYLRTYSRWIEHGNKVKKEKWHETVKRVVEGCFTIQKMHCYEHKVPWNNAKAQNSAKIMYDMIFHMKFLPPGRGLWMMGTEYIEKHGSAALNNCAFVSTKNIAQDPITPFKFLMDMSMLGVGVGFDTKGAGTIDIQKPTMVEVNAIIPDTREGWVEAMAIVLNGYFTGSEIPNFDYSVIRPAGEQIKGFGGEASGPGPLKGLVKSLELLLEERVGKPITSTDIVDICDMIGKCVVSGNVRRSALIALGDSHDKDYIEMKDPKKYKNELKRWRWASNNSVRATVGQDYAHIAEQIGANGEPGVIWLENAKAFGRLSDPPNNLDYKAEGCNPCGEQTLESYELCCLVETFPSLHDSYDEYQRTLKYAYLYAKTVTLIPTHWEPTNAVMLRNRRIGTSQSGIIDAFACHGRREMLGWCERGYNYLRRLDGIYSDWLCIPRSIKITSIKPSGSVSKLPGVSPGIHYPHAEYYIQRIRVAANSPLVDIMKAAGYTVEQDVADESAMVIEFPVHTENFIKGKAEVTMWEQFLNAADYQRFWCDNQVSITVTFKPEEVRDIGTALSIFDSDLKSVSMLPLKEHGYEQPPFETITQDRYEKMTAKLSHPNFSSFTENAEGERYCDGDTCQI